MTVIIKENQKQCVCCGKVKSTKINFYQSDSKDHFDSLIPYCKHCLKKGLNESNEKSVHKTLSKIDKPFIGDVWDKAVESNKETLGTYLSSLNIKHKDLSYFDGEMYKEIKPAAEIVEEENIVPSPRASIKITEDLLNKWGFGYEDEEILAFERKYSLLRNNYQEKTAMHTEALLTYIRYRVKEEMATARGQIKDAKDWGALAQKAAQDAKINPSQLSKSDLSDGLDTFGQLVRSVEQAQDIIPILPQFKERPQDKVDFALLCYINYVRDLKGLPLATYEEVYDFYEERKKEYASRNVEE
ncbi:hypothetical protein [Priestia aryabhattai]|uniref:hypothetical protein n=1 Tax=Priestia aryabhattai TaxID=412384 RepID=UPI0015F6A553|nr:hypothetical protein [Priestia aryabhattai]